VLQRVNGRGRVSVRLCQPDPCTLLISEPNDTTLRPDSGLDIEVTASPSSRLTVIYAVHNDRSYPMRRHIPVPHGHLISHVWQDGVYRDARAKGWYRKGDSHEMPCEAARIRGRVYAAYYPRGRKWSSSVGQGELDLF